MAKAGVPKFGIVTWWDTHSSDDWIGLPDQYVPAVMHSGGFIIEKSEGVIVLANRMTRVTEDGQDFYYGTSYIPRGCIRSIQYLNHE